MSKSAGARRSDVIWGLLIEIPAALVIFAMMLYVTANALMRTYANQPFANSLEMVQYWMLPIIALLGFVAAQHRRQHISTDLLFKGLPEVTKRPLLTGGYLLGAVVAAGFAWYGWGEAMSAFEVRRNAGVTGLPSWPVYFVVPFAFAVLTAQWLTAAIQELIGRGEELT